MNILSKVNDWRLQQTQLHGKTIGFIPTMGNLHAGHLSLVDRSRQENDITVVSIFVNPAQFNQTSDFDKYPRTLADDVALLEAQQVDYLFAPETKSMYPDDYQLQVIETTDSTQLEGEFRPGHFNGVLTIVLKLLNIIQPTRAYFGEKDYQQLLLVKKMVQALFVPTEIIGCPTVRAEDGLALSSRNSRLSLEQRNMAAHIPRVLQSEQSLTAMIEELSSLGFIVEYIKEKWQRRLAAVQLGDVRLIDNVEI